MLVIWVLSDQDDVMVGWRISNQTMSWWAGAGLSKIWLCPGEL